MSIRKRVLWSGLLLIVAAALWWMPDQEVADSLATRSPLARTRTSHANVSTARPVYSVTRANPAAPGEIVELFPNQDWSPLPDNSKSAEPLAPPLPFTYGGRYTENDTVFVFLVEGAKLHAARLGTIVNGNYRIDSISPAAVTLTYLPLGLPQTLAIL